MSSSILFDPKGVSYMELVGNGKKFNVPRFQRDYSWSEEHWDDLWRDIIEVRDGNFSNHYMGSLVVTPENIEDPRSLSVIDGQQRLTTISILIVAVLQQLKVLVDQGVDPDANKEREQLLRDRFLGSTEAASLIQSSKLTLNDASRGFFEDHLINFREPKAPKNESKSNQLLWDCFRYFRDQIQSDALLAGNGRKLAEFVEEVIGRKLNFIQITVPDQLSAFTVFETLNARGVELTVTDLLKNYFFAQLSTEEELKHVSRRWTKILSIVRPEKFAEFLRYYLLCTRPTVRSQRLFKIVRDEIRSKEDVLEMLERLEELAALYAALNDSTDSFWDDFPEARKSVAELNLFQTTQYMPLVFAVYRACSTQIESVLRQISVISFRFGIISRRNTNPLERVYHSAANAVLSGESSKPIEIFGKLKEIYVPDEEFETAFIAASSFNRGRSKKIAKYILSVFEKDLSGAETYDSSSGTLEHVLPENPSSEWYEIIPESRWERLIYSIGNLTLLENSLNRQSGNQGYALKRDLYSQSRFSVTSELLENDPDEWTAESIVERQKRMAKRAIHLWRLDF